MPTHDLPLTGYEARLVLMPSPADPAKTVEALCITVYGPHFPQRALAPEIVVGDRVAERVSITRDQTAIRGYLRDLPPDGAPIVVRYEDSQVGRLREGFSRKRVRPLPRECSG
jgi:hypothetical protein